MSGTSVQYSRGYQRSKEFAQTFSRISKRDLRTWKQGPQGRSAARNASPRYSASCSRDAITSTRTASQAPPRTSGFDRLAVEVSLGQGQYQQRGQAPLPDLFFFMRIRGMNKSGRGACPRCWY